MYKKELFQLRMSKKFKDRVKQAARYFDMTITEYVRAAIIDKLKRDDK